MASEPLDTWKDYLTFHAIESHAALLPAAFGSEAFAFFGPVLSGAQKQRDRWKRGVSATNGALGFAVGQALHRALLPAGGEEAGPGDGGEPHGRVRETHRPARLDGAEHQEGGQGQARRAQGRASAFPTPGPTTPGSRS